MEAIVKRLMENHDINEDATGLAEDSPDNYWVILYKDETYHETRGTKSDATELAEKYKEYKGGSYRLVPWND